MTHDQKMMVFAIRCCIDDGNAEQAARLACGLAHQMRTQAAKDRKNAARRGRDEAYRSCGLVKVRGALGGVYWE